MTPENFWAHIAIRGPEECWEWIGYRARGKYGVVTIKKRTWNAHRIAWELQNTQKIPTGMDACHSCDNPPCCNPSHIWIGTRKENLQDCARKGRQWKQQRTHCVHGHLLQGDNIRLVPNTTRRVCRICDKARGVKYRRGLGAKERIFLKPRKLRFNFLEAA